MIPNNNFENRKNKIEDFLKKSLQMALDDMELSRQKIYNELIRYGIEDEELHYLDNDSLFHYWTNRYMESKNIDVAVDNIYFNGNFCIFKNYKNGDNILNYSDPVKIYLSYDSNHLRRNVDLIMDFLEKNNIVHYSKVAKIYRNDMLTIRIPDINQAYKVIDFINRNASDGYIETNPFCIKDGVVGLAIDNYNSYNSRVAELICDYLAKKISSNDFDVSYDDFVLFTKDYEFKNDGLSKTRNNKIYLDEIKNLIYISITSDKIEDFNNHYYNVSKNKNKKGIINKANSDILLETLSLFVKATIVKHGPSFAKNGLIQYLDTGRCDGLSRVKDNNGKLNRNLLKRFNYKDMKKALIMKYKKHDSSYLAESFISEITNERNNKTELTNEKNDKNEVIDESLIKFFSKIVNDTYQKYGYEQVFVAVFNFLKNGYTGNFTRYSIDGEISRDRLIDIDYNQLRENLMMYCGSDDIDTVISKFLNDYIVIKSKSNVNNI